MFLNFGLYDIIGSVLCECMCKLRLARILCICSFCILELCYFNLLVFGLGNLFEVFTIHFFLCCIMDGELDEEC